MKFGNVKIKGQTIVPALGAIFCLLILLSNFTAVYFAAHEAMCEMACCRGRAPHSARNCSGGFCHFPLAKSKKTAPKILDEKICGAKDFKQRVLAELQQSLLKKPFSDKTGNRFGDSIFHDRDARNADDSTAVKNRSLSLGQGCRSDCGTATASFNPNQKKFIRALPQVSSFAAKPRPPTPQVEPEFNFEIKRKLNQISRRISPRAPPVSV